MLSDGRGWVRTSLLIAFSAASGFHRGLHRASTPRSGESGEPVVVVGSRRAGSTHLRGGHRPRLRCLWHVRPSFQLLDEVPGRINPVCSRIPLKTNTCTGRGGEGESGYRRFFCVGVFWLKGLGYSLPVRIRYVLAPLGQYRGTQPPYKSTWVRFDSFGVP